MSISDDLAKMSTRGGNKCMAGETLVDFPELADELAHAYGSFHYTARQVVDVVSKYGVDLSAGSLRRHRRGECACR